MTSVFLSLNYLIIPRGLTRLEDSTPAFDARIFALSLMGVLVVYVYYVCVCGYECSHAPWCMCLYAVTETYAVVKAAEPIITTQVQKYPEGGFYLWLDSLLQLKKGGA